MTPARPCLRCGTLTYSGSYCPKHGKRTLYGGKFNGYAWQKIRSVVLARDGYTCTRPACSEVDNLEVHHIHPLRHGGSDQMDNLTTLCRKHHLDADRRTPQGW